MMILLSTKVVRDNRDNRENKQIDNYGGEGGNDRGGVMVDLGLNSKDQRVLEVSEHSPNHLL